MGYKSKWRRPSPAPAASSGAKDRDLPPILGKGDDRNPYFDSSCAVLELVDYDALDASTSSAFRVEKRWKGEGMEEEDDNGGAHHGTMRTSAASSVPQQKAAPTGVDLLDRRHVGLLVSVLVAGFLSSSLKRGLLQLMESDLELTEYQGDAAEALLLMPWSYSFLLGFLADVFPILGSRRRAYIILGWVTTFLAFFAVAFLNYVEEYDAKIAAAASTSGVDTDTDTDAEVTAENRGALIALYMLLLMLASLGVILSILIAEVHVVGLCRDREPLLERGAAVGTLLLAQFTGDTAGQLVADRVIFRITSLGITPLYSFRTVALFLMFLALVPLPGLLLGFRGPPRPSKTERETSSSSSSSLQHRRPTLKQRIKIHWRVLRGTLGERSTTAVTRFLFLFVFFSEFSLTFPLEQLATWCGVDAKAMSSSNIIQKVLYVCAITMWKFNGLNASWRAHLGIGYLLVFLAPELVYFLLAAFDEEARSASAYAIVDALQGYVRALIVVLEIAMAVEIAPVGGEGAVVGAIVSIATIMRLLATACSNVLGYAINDDSASGSDSDDKRSLVGFALAVCFAIRTLALFGLLFLPRQKRELQRMHRRRRDVRDYEHHEEEDAEDAQAKRHATWTIAGFAAAFSVSLVYNWLAVAPATSCLALVGGSGC